MEGSIAPQTWVVRWFKVNEVLHNTLVVVHVDICEVSLGFTFRVVQSEVIFQFSDFVGEIVKPRWSFSGGQQHFEPI